MPTLGKPSENEREMMRKLFFLTCERKEAKKKVSDAFALNRARQTKNRRQKKSEGKILFFWGRGEGRKKTLKLFELNLNIVYFAISRVDTGGRKSELKSVRTSSGQKQPGCNLSIRGLAGTKSLGFERLVLHNFHLHALLCWTIFAATTPPFAIFNIDGPFFSFSGYSIISNPLRKLANKMKFESTTTKQRKKIQG